MIMQVTWAGHRDTDKFVLRNLNDKNYVKYGTSTAAVSLLSIFVGVCETVKKCQNAMTEFQ